MALEAGNIEITLFLIEKKVDIFKLYNTKYYLI